MLNCQNYRRFGPSPICTATLLAIVAMIFPLSTLVAPGDILPPAAKPAPAAAKGPRKQAVPPASAAGKGIPPQEIRIFFRELRHGYFQTVRLMLDKNAALANAKWEGETALNEACGSPTNAAITARILLSHGADPNRGGWEGWKPLAMAGVYRSTSTPYKGPNGRIHRSVLDVLISLGARVNAYGKHGQTALMAAATYNRLTAVRVLLKDGANPYAQNSKGKTALDMIGDYRADVSPLPVARELLSAAPALISLCSRSGRRPLFYAAIGHQFSLVKLLIARGADVNARGGSGGTALMATALQGETKMAQFLLAHGADARFRDSYYYDDPGHTAAYYATFFKHFRLAAILRKAEKKRTNTDTP